MSADAGLKALKWGYLPIRGGVRSWCGGLPTSPLKEPIVVISLLLGPISFQGNEYTEITHRFY